MAEPDWYYTGGTIIMDHGHGISTIYSHLETVMVSVGDKINQGDIIGTVGSTGRSTGPHLDFRVNWFQTRLDPMSVINWVILGHLAIEKNLMQSRLMWQSLNFKKFKITLLTYITKNQLWKKLYYQSCL